MKGSDNLLLEFWETFHMVEARNFKFGTQMTTRGSNKKCKILSGYQNYDKSSRDFFMSPFDKTLQIFRYNFCG